MKKAIAISLAILMLISTFPAVNVFAANDEHIVITEEKETPDLKVPDGYIFSFDWTDDNGKTYYCYESEPSEFGLINMLWLDENGNEVNDPATPFVPHDDGMNVKSGTLPAAYDAREKGLITSVKNQRRTGTCWAHAATSCIETSIIKQGLADNSIDLNEYYMVRYTQNGYISGVSDSRNDGNLYLGNENTPTFLDRGGNYTYVEAVSKSFTSPVVNEKFIFENDGSSTAPFAEELNEKLTFNERFDYDYILNDCYLVNDDISEIKEALLKYGSVQASYHSSTEYYTQENFSYYNMTEPCAFYCPEKLTTNHAITIVGWNDDFSADNFRSDCKPERNGAWLVKNSWSEYFGNNGYFWLSYEDKTISTFVVYEAAGKDEFENVYLYDGIYSSYRPTIPGSNAAANVFVAESNEFITKVYNNTVSDSTAYSIYKLAEGYTSPVDGELLYSYTGPTNGEKYIDVYGDVYLAKGDIFSVVFENGSARYEGRNKNDTLANTMFTSNANESFYRDRNGKWHDAAEENYNNVIVRAVTTSEKTADSYRVKFSCPGKKDIIVYSDGNTVELPSQRGYTYVFNNNGEIFDGTDVTHDMYIEMHAYITNGTAREESPCISEYKCEFCGKEILPSETVHNYSSSFTAPTCKTEGYTTYTCIVCGDTYIGSEKVQKSAHSFVLTVIAPTCTEGGYTTYTCSVCGDTYTADETTAKGHTPDSGTVTKAETCAEPGVKTFKCTVCGVVTGTEAIKKLAHTEKVVNGVSPTCTESGLSEGKNCSVCGAVIKAQQILDPINHLYSTVVTSATCTTNGFTTYTCQHCGDSYITDRISSAGHRSDDGTVTTQATCTDTGIKTYKCLTCGTVLDTEIIAKTEHDYKTVRTEATCTKDGAKVTRCTVCSDVKSTETIPARGHIEVVSKHTKEPTCTKAGNTVEKKCAVCGVITVPGKTIPANGHTDEDDDSVCDKCGISITSIVITEPCSCNCHDKGLLGFIWKIMNIFYELFGINRTCNCGEKHY